MSKRRPKCGPDDFRSRFGFHSTPFSRELPVDRRHQLTYVEDVLEGLYRTLLLRESAALIAPAGSGKTVVARALKARLPEARFRVHYVKVTTLSRRDMCREIAMAADCKPAGNYPTLVRRLQDRFERTVDSDGVRPVLILDDAHELRPDTMGCRVPRSSRIASR
jgi:general secretion pathway protein A